jgi:sugar phosphate isomerase/epimerase
MQRTSHPTLAFSTLGCGDRDLDGVVELARRFGVGAIELRVLAGNLDLPAYLAERFGDPKHFAAYLAAANIRVCALGASFRLIGGQPADREALLAYLPWARAADAMLRVFDGGTMGSDAEIAEAGASLAWWHDAVPAEDAGRLMVETHDALCFAPALSAFCAANPATAILWDTHHTWRRGQAWPAETWAILGKQTVHMHVKDSLPAPGEHNDTRNIGLGLGDYPFAALTDLIRAVDYKGVVSLEWERHWHPDLGPIEEQLPLFLEQFRAVAGRTA